MNELYQFPKSSAFGRVVPKKRIYDYGNPTARIKKLFVAQVDKIFWANKLSPQTINVPATEKVKEIQVFTLNQRSDALALDILYTIDKAIPSPIFFELRFSGKLRYAAAYKRPSEADKSKWVISSYFLSEWKKEDTVKRELPVVLNMEALYQFLLKALIPLASSKNENIDSFVTRVEILRSKEREAEMIETRMKKEKQFNRRVELNRTLNALKQEIKSFKFK